MFSPKEVETYEFKENTDFKFTEENKNKVYNGGINDGINDTIQDNEINVTNLNSSDLDENTEYNQITKSFSNEDIEEYFLDDENSMEHIVSNDHIPNKELRKIQ